MPLRNIALGLTFALAYPGAGAALAQQLVFRLPDNEPSPNCDVIRSAAFSPDGSLLAVGYGRFLGLLQESQPGEAVLWESRSGKRRTTFPARKDGVCWATFSPDGRTLAAAEYTGQIRLWDVTTGRERLNIEAGAGLAGRIAFSPDGKRIAAGLLQSPEAPADEPGAEVLVWDAESGKRLHSLKGPMGGRFDGMVTAVAFSPDGKLLVSGGLVVADDGAKVWEIDSGKARATLGFPALRDAHKVGLINVASVAFSPDGKDLVTAAGMEVTPEKPEGVGEVTFWDPATGQRKGTLPGFDGYTYQVAFSPDGKLLVTSGINGVVRLLDAETHAEVGTFKGGPPLAFSPDGLELVMGADARTLVSRKIAEAMREREPGAK